MRTKSERVAAEAAELARNGHTYEAVMKLVEYADRGVRNRHTAQIFAKAIEDDFSDVVTLPAAVAEVALRELTILITQTGEHAGHGLVDSPRPMSPLGLARRCILRRVVDMEGDYTVWLDDIENVFEEIAEETGVDVSEQDPLQDDVFQAKKTLERALGEND